MKLNSAEMPDSGYILAYLRSGVVFAAYEKDERGIHFEGDECLAQDELLECHCFDEQREYRLLKSGDERGMREFIITSAQESAMDPMLLKEEAVLIKEAYATVPGAVERLRVVNRYRYDENDALVLENYRLAGVEIR